MLRITGDKSLDRKFDALLKGAKGKIVRKGLRAAAKEIQQQTITNAPVDSGALRAGIKVRAAKKKKDRAGVVVSLTNRTEEDNAFYAPFVEFGTHNEDGSWRIEPQGFMRRAFDTKADQAAATAKEAFSEEIKKIVKQ